jgi:predicted Zn-dependent peptidase
MLKYQQPEDPRITRHMIPRRPLAAAALIVLSIPAIAQKPSSATHLSIPVQFETLSNGLKVVLSPDPAVPLARVGVYYGAGPRQERRGRGGFAHLFEHLMFEGSAQLGPGDFFKLVTSNGGRFGARTLYDFTKYNVTIPSNTLDLILWAEADRMRGLRIDQARLDAVRATVKNEVRQQSFNRPYGRFVWIDIPELTQTRWENSHSIYGESPDGSMADLDSASVADADEFFAAYYSPANAVLVVQGDFVPARTLVQIRNYFGDIPRRSARPPVDRTEPKQTAEKRFTRIDPNASRPAIAISYHLPPRSDPAFWTMAIIGQILIEGPNSWMYRALVVEKNFTDAIYGGLSAQHGSMYTINGPNFWTAFAFHDKSQSPDSLLTVMDQQIARLQSAPVDSATLARAITMARADYYSELGAGRNEGIVDMLGQLALFGDHPSRINRIEDEFRSVTAERVLAAAREYLRPGNRTVLILNTRDSK